MVKEGEGMIGPSVKGKGRTSMQQVTGQGKETGGIKYPISSLNVIAALEQVYGAMESIPEKEVNAQAVRLMIYLLETQKSGKDEQLAVMNRKELLAAAGKLVKEKNINMDNIRKYSDAAQAVFIQSRRRMKRK